MPAEYAFVLHTANPITGVKGEVFGELVQGMGEALVGNHPGRALSFKVSANGAENVEVGTLPSTILCLLLSMYVLPREFKYLQLRAICELHARS